MEMYHAETDTPACARTSNLNEELGQVKYVFSDKTGTLTQNVMEFQQCSVGGTIYSANNDVIVNSSGMASSMVQDLTTKHSNAPYIREFLTLLAVCHTVIPEKDETNPNVLHYHAASPGSLSRLVNRFHLSIIEDGPELSQGPSKLLPQHNMLTVLLTLTMSIVVVVRRRRRRRRLLSDERALVQGAARLGWVLSSRTPETLTVRLQQLAGSH